MGSACLNRQILIVDRDAVCVDPLRQRLSELGYAVSVITDGAAAIASIAERPRDLVIMDWSTPGLAALEVIQGVKRSDQPHPTRLIILSTLANEQDVVTGLNLGADDYVTKPFSLPEVVARVCSLLRFHKHEDCDSLFACGDLILDRSSNRVMARRRLMNLRGIKYRLLEFLMLNPGRTFNRGQLLAEICAGDNELHERTVDVNVQRLRKILTDLGCEKYIQTVRGFGYRFVAPSSASASAEAVARGSEQ